MHTITYLVKFLLPVVFSSRHGLDAVWQASNNPGRGRLEGNCLAPEINPIQVDRMATQTGWCSARWKAVDCSQGYGGWSKGEWVTPCSSMALVSCRSESRRQGRVVGGSGWAWFYVPRSRRSCMISRAFLWNVVDRFGTLRNTICRDILWACV
jgi:hypothetical protein